MPREDRESAFRTYVKGLEVSQSVGGCVWLLLSQQVLVENIMEASTPHSSPHQHMTLSPPCCINIPTLLLLHSAPPPPPQTRDALPIPLRCIHPPTLLPPLQESAARARQAGMQAEEREREAARRAAVAEEDAKRRRQRAAEAEVVRGFAALLGEVVKSGEASWGEWKERLKKDPQVRWGGVVDILLAS
jgi:hypothetical protein